MALTWDPDQYQRFTELRGRPFLDLLARIPVEHPRRVVDLGCGPGNLTALLARRWPRAVIEGVDSSTAMIAAAAGVQGVTFSAGDIESWSPGPDVDVVVSNAALQWVPSHRRLLEGWARSLPAGGCLAWQVPGNFDSPSHTLMRELAAEPRWADRLAGVLRHTEVVDDPAGYARLLLRAGWTADSWETTYTQVLAGPDPVLEWVRGTGLRPVLQALDAAERAEFEAEYAARLRAAYPPEPDGNTLFPFRRVFAVGHRP